MSALSGHPFGFAGHLRLPRWRQLKDTLRPARICLDPEALPENMKRDLGLSGGRPTPPRDPLRD